MMTLAAIVTLALGVWGAFEVACDLRNDRRHSRTPTLGTRARDVLWFGACMCFAATAAHSLAATWL